MAACSSVWLYLSCNATISASASGRTSRTHGIVWFAHLSVAAGAVTWVRGLKERLQDPMTRLLAMDRNVLELPAFSAAQQRFEAVMAEMQQYEATLVQDWCSQVGSWADVACVCVTDGCVLKHTACKAPLPCQLLVAHAWQ